MADPKTKNEKNKLHGSSLKDPSSQVSLESQLLRLLIAARQLGTVIFSSNTFLGLQLQNTQTAKQCSSPSSCSAKARPSMAASYLA